MSTQDQKTMTLLNWTKRGEPLEHFHKCMQLETDECILWGYSKNSGYGIVSFNNKINFVHRLSLLLKVGEPPIDKPYALHACRNRNCFNYRHLKWGSNYENQCDRLRDGTNIGAIGNKGLNCKLTHEQVLEIYKDSRPSATIAREYNISDSFVRNIKAGRKWGWLTGSHDISNKMYYSDVVKLIMKEKSIGYAKAAKMLDFAIEPRIQIRIKDVIKKGNSYE